MVPDTFIDFPYSIFSISCHMYSDMHICRYCRCYHHSERNTCNDRIPMPSCFNCCGCSDTASNEVMASCGHYGRWPRVPFLSSERVACDRTDLVASHSYLDVLCVFVSSSFRTTHLCCLLNQDG